MRLSVRTQIKFSILLSQDHPSGCLLHYSQCMNGSLMPQSVWNERRLIMAGAMHIPSGDHQLPCVWMSQIWPLLSEESETPSCNRHEDVSGSWSRKETSQTDQTCFVSALDCSSILNGAGQKNLYFHIGWPSNISMHWQLLTTDILTIFTNLG